MTIVCPGLCPTTFFLLEEDEDRLLEDIWPFGMAMLSNDIVESLSKFLKQVFKEHSARGSGKRKATGHSSCGRPKASVNLDTDALGQVLQHSFSCTPTGVGLPFASCGTREKLSAPSFRAVECYNDPTNDRGSGSDTQSGVARSETKLSNGPIAITILCAMAAHRC